MKRLRPFIFGGAVGIAIWCLANLEWRHSGFGHLWAALPVILGQPLRLVVPHSLGRIDAVVLPLVLALEYALAGWLVGLVVRVVRQKRRAPLVVFSALAVVLILCFGITWAVGPSMVREEITRQRAADYLRFKAMYPDRVSNAPELQILYCTPVCPFIVACEYDYIYGGLIGFGKGTLWLWRGSDVKPFCDYAYWVH